MRAIVSKLMRKERARRPPGGHEMERYLARELAHMIDNATPYRYRDQGLIRGARLRRAGPQPIHWISLLALIALVAAAHLAR